MSVQTWKAEFYPPISKVRKSEAAAHSLQKWIGLRKENLMKHGVDEPVDLGSETCALCRHFIYADFRGRCASCPLYIVRDNVSCDSRRPGPDDEHNTPYFAYIVNDDPEPMIAWLEKAVEYQREKK